MDLLLLTTDQLRTFSNGSSDTGILSAFVRWLRSTVEAPATKDKELCRRLRTRLVRGMTLLRLGGILLRGDAI